MSTVPPTRIDDVPLLKPDSQADFDVPLAVRAFGLTDPGKVRDRNEDHFLVAELTKTLRVHHTSLPQPRVREGAHHGFLFVVADGMGGHAGGEVASRLAARTVEEFVLDALKWFMEMSGAEGNEVSDQLRQSLAEADANIVRIAQERPTLHGMGTTLTLAFAVRSELFVVHAGDSRAGLFRGGKLYRLTQEHTLAAELVRRGKLAPGEVATHRLRHIVTNVVGGPKPGVYAEVSRAHLEPRDRLVLCTDGLTDMLGDADVEELLRLNPDPEDAVRKLVKEANARGGKDNITVVVANFDAANEG
jgi:protein phosphatase